MTKSKVKMSKPPNYKHLNFLFTIHSIWLYWHHNLFWLEPVVHWWGSISDNFASVHPINTVYTTGLLRFSSPQNALSKTKSYPDQAQFHQHRAGMMVPFLGHCRETDSVQLYLGRLTNTTFSIGVRSKSISFYGRNDKNSIYKNL